MIYLTHRPAPPLSAHIEYCWFFEGLFPSHTMERVLPNGCFELVIDLRDEPRKLFESEAAGRWREYKKAWISGAQSRYLVIDVLSGSSMIGVRFRPGGAAAFLERPAGEFAEQVVQLDAVWGRAAEELRDALLEEQTPAGKFSVLEAFLGSRLDQSSPSRIDLAIEELQLQPNATRLSALADRLGMSHRRLIDQFRARVGLTPKKFCRIRRFQRALADVEARKQIEWASLAAEAGYYDQAHLIHDFVCFSGLNPSAYFCQRGEHLNFVPLRAP